MNHPQDVSSPRCILRVSVYFAAGFITIRNDLILAEDNGWYHEGFFCTSIQFAVNMTKKSVFFNLSQHAPLLMILQKKSRS